jgi:hypothetical protein
MVMVVAVVMPPAASLSVRLRIESRIATFYFGLLLLAHAPLSLGCRPLRLCGVIRKSYVTVVACALLCRPYDPHATDPTPRTRHVRLQLWVLVQGKNKDMAYLFCLKESEMLRNNGAPVHTTGGRDGGSPLVVRTCGDRRVRCVRRAVHLLAFSSLPLPLLPAA